MDARVTAILNEAQQGKPGAADALLEEVYGQLRKVAQQRMLQERPGHTLQATALVHEAFVRLIGPDGAGRGAFEGRGHFYAAAGEAMRRILIEHARGRGREKRGGGRGKVSLEDIGDVADLAAAGMGGMGAGDEGNDGVIAFDGAFCRLEEHDKAVAEVVRLRFYAGLSVAETALALAISERTVNNRWSYARAWLARELQGGAAG